MKKFKLLTLSAFVVSTVFAQEALIEKMQLLEKVTNTTQSAKSLRSGASTSIWSDDFSDASKWTLRHATTCELDWKIGAELVNRGNYPTPTITSTTAANGYAMIDSDEYAQAQPNDVQSAWITNATPIDLSANQNVLLQFETQYRKFESKCFVVTSTNNTDWPDLNVNFDASTNENVYELFQEINVNEMVKSNPALIEINISPSAGGEGQVWVRFHWTGERYSWFIDDVAIVEQPENDIVLKSGWITNGSSVEYGRIPASQMNDTLVVGGEVFNLGANNQSNVNINVTVSNEFGDEVITASISEDLIEKDSTSYIQNFVSDFTPLAVGNYKLSVTASSDMDNVDGENFTNNTYNRDFAVTENLFSLDGVGVYDDAMLNLSELGSNNFGSDNYNGLIMMGYYNITETTEVSGLEIGISPNSNQGGKILPFIIGLEAYNNKDVYDRIVENEEGVTVSQYNIDNNLIFAPLPATTLEPGVYFACVELNSDNVNHVGIINDITVAQPSYASTIYLPSDETVYTNGNAFAIRLALDNYVAIEENTPKTFSIYPNPSDGVFTVNSTEADTNTIEVINVLGEIVSAKTVVGMMNETFNMSHYKAGLYFVKVSNDTSENVQKIIIK